MCGQWRILTFAWSLREYASALLLAERNRLSLVGIPANGDRAGLRDGLPARADDGLARREAGRPNTLGLDPHRDPPVLVAHLGAQVNLQPDDDVVRVAEHLCVERVPALLEVGQEHHVVDVAHRVRVSPPDVDLAFDDRAHTVLLTDPRTGERAARPTRCAGTRRPARTRRRVALPRGRARRRSSRRSRSLCR